MLSGCQVSASGYLLLSTLPRRNSNVFWFRTQLDPFGVGRTITPVNNVRWAELLTTVSPHNRANAMQRFLKSSNFLRKIFTVPEFDSNLCPEDGQNEKEPSDYPSKSESRPYLLSISNENYNNFLLYLGFFRVQMGPMSKIMRSQLRLAPLFQKPLIKG